MFPRIGGVPRLVETRALSANIAERSTPYDFFVADDRCIVNITNFSGATTSTTGLGYLLNDSTTYNDCFAVSDNRNAIYTVYAAKAQGRLIATAYNNSLLLLLEEGDRIRVICQSTTLTLTATAYIYK